MFAIQHINNYHNCFEELYESVPLGCSQVLNNYLVWFNLARYAKGDSGFIESVWKRYNACTMYTNSKWTFMDRPIIQAA
jgi:hypothetical protein